VKELLQAIFFSKYFIILAVLIIGLLSAYFWYDDNPVEEISEVVIDNLIGVRIDLTPQSPGCSQ
jgi:hypothetical protein